MQGGEGEGHGGVGGDDGLILCFLDHTASGWASYVKAGGPW